MELLERAEELSILVDRLANARASGQLVLVSGEAGAGKSALVDHFCTRHLVGHPVLVGRCDDLFASRPLGPLADIARATGGPLAAAIAAGDQAAAFDAFLGELAASGPPTVIVMEDLQWADEATLDLIRFVTRRLPSVAALLIVTHRDDLAREHPLRRAVGSLAGPGVTRLTVRPLTVEAVRTLAAGTDHDPLLLHRRTAGNPFLVVEVLAADPGNLPLNVSETVLAQAARLPGAARDALDAASVLGRRVDPRLLQEVADCDAAAIDECIRAGLLVDDGRHQEFRHDLVREAIEDALPPLRRRQLHARALTALGEDADIVQRAHHAVGAGDAAAILELAARAGDHSLALGAWSQAATLYGSALEHAGEASSHERERLLISRARACERVERFDDAIAAGEELLAHLRHAGDDRTIGFWESWLGGVYRCHGRAEQAWSALESAVQRLEPLGEGPELARALALLAQHQMCNGYNDVAIAVARRAEAMAERFGLEEVAVHAIDSYGAAMCCQGDRRGIDVLRDALDRAKRGAVVHEITRISNNLAEWYEFSYRPADALPILQGGLDVAIDHELRFNRNSMLHLRATALLLLGRWDEAVADARAVLAEEDLSPTNRASALRIIGRVRARRGDPGALPALDEALALAMPYDEVQTIHPILVARAEAASLAGRSAQAAADITEAIRWSTARPEPWNIAELAVWARRTGVGWWPGTTVPEPFQAMIDGRVRRAAAQWDERECPYEAADALADSAEIDDLRDSLERLTAMGARPRAQQVARRLRELGARDVPRGPRASTRANPAGLTAREVEVAALVATGLGNNEIADRLFLSPKTVDHHVSSILTKLAVKNRRQVAEAAAALGLDLTETADAIRP